MYIHIYIIHIFTGIKGKKRTTGHKIKSAWTRLIPKLCPMAQSVAELATD